MADDLSHAKASVDWAVSNLDSLEARTHEWIKNNIEVVRENTDPNGPYFTLSVVQKTDLPLSFNVEAGAYINAIRSSLDIMATALAYRYGMPRADKVYFPVAGSRVEFENGRGFKGHELVEGLPKSSRDALEALRPYRGGNELLVTLHDMDIQRKHRSLLGGVFTPHAFRFTNLLDQKSVIPSAPGFVRMEKKTVLGKIAKSEEKPEMELRTYIAFDEAFFPKGKRMIGALYSFANLANSIINLFNA